MEIDKTKVIIREISKRIGKDIIVKNHYSHTWTSCRYALGIFYETENQHSFFDEKEEKLVGVIIYGYPVGRSASTSLSKELNPEEVLELTRLFIYDEYGKNMESISISKSFKWLKQNASEIKALISYSDPEQNHLGIIYQATNWIYQGNKIRLLDSYAVKLEKNTNWIHSRTVFATYGSHNLEHLKKKIGHSFWRKKEMRKCRYLYLLCGKKEQKKIIKSLKHPPLPYIKNFDNEYLGGEIEKIEVENKKVGFYE